MLHIDYMDVLYLSLIRQGNGDDRQNAAIYDMLVEIRSYDFACDYCAGRGHIHFPKLHQIAYLSSVRIPHRVPKNVVDLLCDLYSPPMAHAQYQDSFRRHM